MAGTKMKRQIMKRKMLHFSDKTGRVIVVYKLSSQKLRILIMDVQLGFNDFKIEKFFPLLLVICQAHSLPSTEFISAADITIEPHQGGWMRWNHLAGICNWLDPIWFYSLISCLWKRPIAQSARSSADRCTSASHSTAQGVSRTWNLRHPTVPLLAEEFALRW